MWLLKEGKKEKGKQVSELSVKGRQQDLAGGTFVTDAATSALWLLFFVLTQGWGHLKYENRNLHCLLKAAYLCACLWFSTVPCCSFFLANIFLHILIASLGESLWQSLLIALLLKRNHYSLELSNFHCILLKMFN